MPRVGPLEHSHRPALETLLRSTGSFQPEEIDVALELFDETYASSADAGAPADYEFVAVFDDEGSLAGYACFGATPGADGTYDLYWIAVDPARQGRGLGSRLLGEVERRLQERQARMLVVETSGRDAYEATRRFYGARGYQVTARLRDFYAPADDRVVYTRYLGSSLLPAERGV
jgi:ribosomal protein S18 acetylase RimI-like enzyme